MKYRIIAGAMLAIAAFTASATTAELTIDVFAKTKSQTSNGTSSFDQSFKPVKFSMVFKFDLENPYQDLMLSPYYKPWALTILDYTTTSSSKTPFTDALTVPPPEGAYVDAPLTQAGFSRIIQGWNHDADVVFPTTDSMHFTSSEGWWQTPSESPTSFKHTYWRGFNLIVDSPQLSRNQLSTASGEEIFSFLQSQVGKSFANTFYEDSWLSTGLGNVVNGTSIRGDIFVRSAAVVPEPGTFALCTTGLALIAWRRRLFLKKIPNQIFLILKKMNKSSKILSTLIGILTLVCGSNAFAAEKTLRIDFNLEPASSNTSDLSLATNGSILLTFSDDTYEFPVTTTDGFVARRATSAQLSLEGLQGHGNLSLYNALAYLDGYSSQSTVNYGLLVEFSNRWVDLDGHLRHELYQFNFDGHAFDVTDLYTSDYQIALASAKAVNNFNDHLRIYPEIFMDQWENRASYVYFANISAITAVPEPSACLAFSMGMLLIVGRYRRLSKVT